MSIGKIFITHGQVHTTDLLELVCKSEVESMFIFGASEFFQVHEKNIKQGFTVNTSLFIKSLCQLNSLCEHLYTHKALTTHQIDMSLVLRKPVFGVSDQVRHKPGCTSSEDG